jgi:thiol-disulfide isomerase/thioredoxin
MLPRLARLLVVAPALAALGCKPTSDDMYAALPSVGSPVPAFQYASLDGPPLNADALRGGPAVVALWSSRCSASRLALAALSALHAEYAPRGARVVVLADDRDQGAIDSLLRQADVRAPVALASGSLMDTFTHHQSPLPWRKAFALPTFLVLDPAGRVIYRQIGVELEESARLSRVRTHLDSLLAGPDFGAARAPAS